MNDFNNALDWLKSNPRLKHIADLEQTFQKLALNEMFERLQALSVDKNVLEYRLSSDTIYYTQLRNIKPPKPELETLKFKINATQDQLLDVIANKDAPLPTISSNDLEQSALEQYLKARRAAYQPPGRIAQASNYIKEMLPSKVEIKKQWSVFRKWVMD
ncbi:MAG: hypothetical protein RJQ09_09600 [Cyclobacteriaceae bacterium]